MSGDTPADAVGRRSTPKWTREGGEGLPPNDIRGHQLREDATTYLFTCCSCGWRAVNPPGPPAGDCECGGEYVAHIFDPAEYSRIRWYGDPRLPEEVDDGD